MTSSTDRAYHPRADCLFSQSSQPSGGATWPDQRASMKPRAVKDRLEKRITDGTRTLWVLLFDLTKWRVPVSLMISVPGRISTLSSLSSSCSSCAHCQSTSRTLGRYSGIVLVSHSSSPCWMVSVKILTRTASRKRKKSLIPTASIYWWSVVCRILHLQCTTALRGIAATTLPTWGTKQVAGGDQSCSPLNSPVRTTVGNFPFEIQS